MRDARQKVRKKNTTALGIFLVILISHKWSILGMIKGHKKTLEEHKENLGGIAAP